MQGWEVMKNELKDKIDLSSPHNESEVHKKLKYWIAKKYLDSGTSIDNIEFEYKIDESSHVFTIPDVYIKQSGNIAVYCETKLNWQWLWRFVEKNLPILNQFTKKQVVVFPSNVSALYPTRTDNKEYYKEFRDRNVEVLFSHYKLDIKKTVTMQISNEAFEILNNLRLEHSKELDMSDFIINDLKKLIKNPGVIV